MTNLPINDKTNEAIEGYLARPGQSVGLIGKKWSGNDFIAALIAEQLLNLEPGSLSKYPYYIFIQPEKSGIGVDQIRSINEFTMLKVPRSSPINRLAYISQAELMTAEAQNALLKQLEEPPLGTVFILSANSKSDLLPTVLSRLHLVTVHKPTQQQLIEHYQASGHDIKAIKQALLISGGLPELMDLLLTSDQNSINQAAAIARNLLSGSSFERLSQVNELAKDKQQLSDVFFIIKQMAKISLSSDDPKTARRWSKILSAAIDSEDKLNSNAQTKLMLTNFMLAIS